MSVSVASPTMELPQSPIDMVSQSPKPTRQPQDAADFSAMAQQQAAAAIAFQQQLFQQQQQQYLQAYQAHQAQQSRQVNMLPPPLSQVQHQHTQQHSQPRPYHSAYTHQPLHPSSPSSSPISLHSPRPAPHPYPPPSPDYMATPRRRAVSGPRSPQELYMNTPSPSQSHTAAQAYAHQVGRLQTHRQGPAAPYDPHMDPAYRRARTGSSDGALPRRDQYPRQVMRPSPLGDSSRPQSYHADGIYPNGEAGSSSSVTSATSRERIRLNAGMPSRPSYGSRPSSIISDKSSAPSAPSPPGDTAETGRFPTPLPSPLSQLSSIDTKDAFLHAKKSIPNAREDTVVQPGKLPPKSGFKGRLRKAFTNDMNPNFHYSQTNTSVDNVSISSTASSASVMIRKLGNVGRLAKRASVIGLTSLFKDGKKGRKADASTGDVSHVTVESEGSVSQAGPALSAINATAVTGSISSTPATAVMAAARGQSSNTDDVEVASPDAKKSTRKRFSLADFGRSKPKDEESIQRAVMEASELRQEKSASTNATPHPPFVRSVSATNFREVKSILKKPAVHKVTQDVILPVRPMTSNRAATEPLLGGLMVINADPKDENGSDVSSSPSDYFSFTEAHLSAPTGTPTEITPSPVSIDDIAIATPPTPEIIQHKPTKRSLSFSQSISIHDTWTASDYDRRGEQATCHRLTPLLAQRIKQELNAFKMEEMEVHLESRALTHFFA